MVDIGQTALDLAGLLAGLIGVSDYAGGQGRHQGGVVIEHGESAHGAGESHGGYFALEHDFLSRNNFECYGADVLLMV